jgi:hypothetical protein
MRRSGRSRLQISVAGRETLGHAALAALGALAVGLWLGVLAGLATRPRRDQPAGPPVYADTADPVRDQTRATT